MGRGAGKRASTGQNSVPGATLGNSSRGPDIRGFPTSFFQSIMFNDFVFLPPPYLSVYNAAPLMCSDKSQRKTKDPQGLCGCKGSKWISASRKFPFVEPADIHQKLC